MHKTLTTLFAIAVSLAPCTSQAQNMKAPDGYQWVSFPEVKAYFLKPTGWHFHKETKNQKLAAFISKEQIVNGSQYQTGLSVNVIRNVHEKKQRMSAMQFALAMRDATRERVKIDKEWESTNGPFQGVGFIYTHKGLGSTFRCHNILICNPKTGTLYIVTFEAPAAEWEQAWKNAEPMIQKLYLDDEI